MKNRKFLVWVAFCVVPIVILGLAIGKHHLIVENIQKGNFLAASWSAQNFQSISNDSAFTSLLHQMHVNNDASIGKDELDLLYGALNDFYLAYHQGDFDSYHRFRIPTGKGHYDPALLKWLVHDIEAAGQKPVTTNLEDGDLVLQDYWGKVGKQSFTAFFQGLCFEESQVAITTNNTLVPDLTTQMAQIKLSSYNPTFISEPRPQDIKDKFGTISIATLTSLVKNADGTAFPIVCQWYYDPLDKLWIVEALGDDHGRGGIKQKTHLIF